MIGTPGNSKYAKKFNRLTVLNLIKETEPISRQELAALTGLKSPAITGIVRQLLALGLVREVGLGKSKSGRRPMKIRFNADAGYIVGVEITRCETTIAITDLKNQPTEFKTMNIDMSCPDMGLQHLANTLHDVITSEEYYSKRFWGMGIAFPGLLDSKTGVVKRSVNLGQDWVDYPLKEKVQELLAMPISVENNSNAAVLGERFFGKGQHTDNLVYINLGEGVSAGILANKQILQGHRGYAGEIGHLVIQPNGSLCNCGNRGCLETVCGIPAILQRAQCEIPLQIGEDPIKQWWLRANKHITIEELMRQAGIPGSYAGNLFKQIGSYVGLAVANIINIYNPEAVIIGGKLAGAGDVLLKAVQDGAIAQAFPEIAATTDISSSAFGDKAAVIGACALIVRQLLDSPETKFLEEC